MKITFVNVGYGEAVWIRCPDPARQDGEFSLLIDGGSGEAGEYAAPGRVTLWQYLRQSGVGRVDCCVVTHPHEDHVCGLLETAEHLPIGELVQGISPALCAKLLRPLDESMARDLSQKKFLEALNGWRMLLERVKKGGALRQVMGGETLTPCPDLTIRVLGPSPAQVEALERSLSALFEEKEEDAFLRRLSAVDAGMNNFSLILLLEYRGSRILLPGDTNCRGYGGVARESLCADLFKVGHHGQKDGADAALLDLVRPRHVVCCASSDRRYNSADPALLEMIAEKGARLWFSDSPPVPGQTVPRHSSLTFTTEGNGVISGEYGPVL